MKAIESVHFKIVKSEYDINPESGQFFAPKFLYWMLGDDERIMGYEGLQVVIYLSAKRLIPYVELNYSSKAPISSKVDDIIGKLQKHYGTLYTDKNEFVSKVLQNESSVALPG